MSEMTSAVSPRAKAPQPVAGLRAPMNFIRPQDTKPVFHSSALTGGEPKIFFDVDSHMVTIEDMRDIADTLSIDREGFKLLRHPTAVADLYDDEAVKQVYYPEIEALLRREFGASKVAVFDATRRSDGGQGARNPDGQRGPATRVHVDYTVTSGPQRVKDISRRSGSGPSRGLRRADRPGQCLASDPRPGGALAARAGRRVERPEAEELLATDQIFPNRVGEIYNVAYAPEQRWYYASRMTRDEVILIKGWDSVEDGRARFTPHSAFALPDTREDAPPRESIEVRTLVVIE